MAILERPHQPLPSTSSARPAGGPKVVPRAQDRSAQVKQRNARRLQNLPIVLLAVVACVSVGYGFGTLVQFDRDWRDTAPGHLATVDGSAARGAALDQAVIGLLADHGIPVSDINCTDGSRVGSTADGQLCTARGEAGMVSILATGSGSYVHLEVFGAQ